MDTDHPFTIRLRAEDGRLLLVAPNPAHGWALDPDQAHALAKELAEQASILKRRHQSRTSRRIPSDLSGQDPEL